MTERASITDAIVGDMLASPAQTLVKVVNTVGVIGKRVAPDPKWQFPDMFGLPVAVRSGRVSSGESYMSIACPRRTS